MEARDWIELLEYLIKRLTEIGATDFADEVRIAALARITEEPHKALELNLRLPASYYRELGSITTRLPSPKEAFIQATEALKVRLQMMPSLGEHLAKSLGVEPKEIIWKAENKEYEFLSNTSDFIGSKLILSDKEKQSISELLQKLDALTRQA